MVAENTLPNQTSQMWFHLRAWTLRIQRALENRKIRNIPTKANLGDFPFVLGEFEVPIMRGDESESEKVWMRGKRINLEVASSRLNGRFLRKGTHFSFWSLVGPPWRRYGFVEGRELRSGCVIPTVGGGLCALSGLLFKSASAIGFPVLERHQHSRSHFPGRDEQAGEATIFWNYLDLRFEVTHDVYLECRVTRTHLIVGWRTREPVSRTSAATELPKMRKRPLTEVRDCLTCGKNECRRRASNFKRLEGLGVLKVNEAFPDGAHFYRFLSRVVSHRRLAATASIARSSVLAHAWKQRIRAHRGPLEVPQRLVPHLWKLGVLENREYTVDLTFLPMSEMNIRLDQLAARYPESQSLREYRAPADLVSAEALGLKSALARSTKHAALANFADRVVPTPNWNYKKREHPQLRRILFPGPVAYREGIQIVAEIVEELRDNSEIEIVHLGRTIEDSEDWRRLKAKSIRRQDVDWSEIDAVLHPTLFESSVELYREALAVGVPVYLSHGCGMPSGPGCTVFDPNSNQEIKSVLTSLKGLR